MQTRTKNSAATLGAIAALAAACAAHSAAAAERSFDLDAGLAAGYQYDSNVGYTDIDTLSGAADTATRLRARVAAKLTLGRVTLTGSPAELRQRFPGLSLEEIFVEAVRGTERSAA